MTEPAPKPAATAQNDSSNGESTAGMPYYDKTRQHLKQLLERKRTLERFLTVHEDAIYRKETEYLEETPQGNIITGFDGYTKGAGVSSVGRGGAAGAGRKGGLGESHRVFSGSSHTWNSNTDSPAPSAASTPIATQAPTPLASSFQKGGNGEGALNHATPTSTTSGKGGSKKNKKSAAGDDSENDSNPKETKKARTNFGAVRK